MMFNEPTMRYLVMRNEQYVEGGEHWNALVEAGLDPRENWVLSWSFADLDRAMDRYQYEITDGVYANSSYASWGVYDSETNEFVVR